MQIIDHTPRIQLPGFKLGLRFAAVAAVGALALCVSFAPASNIAYGEQVTTANGATQDESDESAQANDNLYGNEKIEVDILADELGRAKTASLIVSTKAAAEKYHVDAIAARMPEQQERSRKAARNLYKMQQDRYDIVEMLISAETIDEFIMRLDYLHDISQANVREINLASEMKEQSEERQSKFEEARSLALDQISTIEEQLEAEQAKRIARAEEGAAIAILQAESYNENDDSADDEEDEDGDNKNTSKKTSSQKLIATTDTSALADGADWSQTKEEFVAEWAPRIDTYLQGSPLYGQGENFAKSAWKYCIDPRWSAAISFTESSKGSVCIRPHNAWGWGAADSDPYNLAAEWGSWAEAIDAHARGLANGYGYTISMSAAQVYCPYTWQSWYNRTLGQMALI